MQRRLDALERQGDNKTDMPGKIRALEAQLARLSRLVSVTPLSLGLDAQVRDGRDMEARLNSACDSGTVVRIIERNSTIPTKKSKVFHARGATKMYFKVYEGEHEKASDNNLLGEFAFTGIQGEKLEVAMEIDADGILYVSATEQPTGRRQSLTIDSGTSAFKSLVDISKKVQQS
ncbi:unnamed protein product [Vitrella brassicaformis CCMP3155]|uniref:Uncharacterized protein n=2 Tax=Vitrella brassicaformis TaxID=1169539 RepID=A0A0G4FFS1_VITBC|nr:unnamed protein product [Vitrella brassicaformis CCMP3155]|eukprot:CEM12030.1 unnamed protein product [Vitrella brassicaformis CCMP3155]